MTGVFEDHLGLDAIVAYADGELGLTAYQRAAAHLARCERCAAEVAEQVTAQEYLRAAGPPRMPGSLFDTLRSIPVAMPSPDTRGSTGPTGGPGSGPSGAAVSGGGVTGPGRVGLPPAAPASEHGRGRRFRLGAGAMVAGLAVGAVVAAAGAEQPGQPAPLQLRTSIVSFAPAGSGESGGAVAVKNAIRR